jgi:hypothetical protein
MLTGLERVMTNPPTWFKVVAIVALLWNLMGCAAYLSDVTLSDEDVAKMTPAQQSLYESRPVWAVSATAVAVWFGAIGSLGLILRKRWALPFLVLSLLGVIVQDIALFGMSDAGSQAGAVAFVLQGVVLLVAIGLVMLASKASKNGWVT